MAELEGSKTEQNLRTALALECVASLRYQYFARQADVDGQPEAASLFRSIAEGEAGHAFGHLEFLDQLDDPHTGSSLKSTADHLEAAIANERSESTAVYPEFARTAREEGLEEIAEWMESLSRAEDGNATRLAEGFDRLM